MQQSEAVTAHGIDHDLELRSDVLIVWPKGLGASLRRVGRMAVSAYRDPMVLVDDVSPPQRRDLMNILMSDNDAFVALAQAMQRELGEAATPLDGSASPDERRAFVHALLDTLRTNRAAVVAAFRSERRVLVTALKSKSEAARVLIAQYFDREDADLAVTLEALEEPRARAVIIGGGARSVVDLEDSAREDFQRLVDALEHDRSASAPSGEVHSQIQALADLHDAGALTPEEFSAAKSRLLESER